MSEEEIAGIVGIMLTADGHCIVCGAALCNKLIKMYPLHEQLIADIFEDYHEQKLSDQEEH